jgi:death-on-curing protein
MEAVVDINQAVVAITGEPHLLRDRGLLESALARPRNFFGFGEEDIVVLAVSLMAGIARAHAFTQGNKRTCFVAMAQFLKANGFDLAIEDSRSWAEAIIALVEHRSSEDEFVRAVRPFVIGDE